MHVHILGIAGTFMASLALLARERGHTVSGADQNVYPPMSTQLDQQGIRWHEGYDPALLEPAPDTVVIGNALSRGNPVVEAVLDRGLPYTSGAQWVAENILRHTGAREDREVLAVAGTHGKTTTASLLAWILDHAGLAPGFLIGGVPENFGVSARLGSGRPFVIEADEYDTAFFDKRSKFVHYRPRVAILNNLEYDHADIFPDLAAIQRQFHHLVRTVPAGGRLIVNAHDKALAEVLAMGTWSPVETFAVDGAGVNADWRVCPLSADCSAFELFRGKTRIGQVEWSLPGRHNMLNAVAAVAASAATGVDPAAALAALAGFRNARRRLEVRGVINGVTVIDDFAHHPTAIAATLEAMRAHVGTKRLIAVLEPRSNTMKLGVHRDLLGPSLVLADRIHLFRPTDLSWNLERVLKSLDGRGRIHTTLESLIEAVAAETQPGDHIVIMSNGAFGGIQGRLMERLGQGLAVGAVP